MDPPSEFARWDTSLLQMLTDRLSGASIQHLFQTGDLTLSQKLSLSVNRFNGCIENEQMGDEFAPTEFINTMMPRLSCLTMIGSLIAANIWRISNSFILPVSLTSLKLCGISLIIPSKDQLQDLHLPNLTSLSLKSFAMYVADEGTSFAAIIFATSSQLRYFHLRIMSASPSTAERGPFPPSLESLRVPKSLLVKHPVPPSVTKLRIYESRYFPSDILIPLVPDSVTDVVVEGLQMALDGASVLDHLPTTLLHLRLALHEKNVTSMQLISQLLLSKLTRFTLLQTFIIDRAILPRFGSQTPLDFSVLPRTLTRVSSELSLLPGEWRHLQSNVQFEPISQSSVSPSWNYFPFRDATKENWVQHAQYLPKYLRQVSLNNIVPIELVSMPHLTHVDLAVWSLPERNWRAFTTCLPSTLQHLNVRLQTVYCLPWFNESAKERLCQLTTLSVDCYEAPRGIHDNHVVDWLRHLPTTLTVLQLRIHPPQGGCGMRASRINNLKMPPLAELISAPLTRLTLNLPMYQFDIGCMLVNPPGSLQLAEILLHKFVHCGPVNANQLPPGMAFWPLTLTEEMPVYYNMVYRRPPSPK